MLEFKHLSRAEKNIKQVREDQPILLELKAVSDLLHEANNERSSPGNWALSFKEGTKIVAETAYKRIFVHIRDIVANPYANDVPRHYVAAQMKALHRELAFLFGDGTLGVTRVSEWLEHESTMGDKFTRQRAFKEIRLLFPYRKETHSRIYQFFLLPELDQALDDGLTEWNEEGRADADPESDDDLTPSTSASTKTSLRALYGNFTLPDSLSDP